MTADDDPLSEPDPAIAELLRDAASQPVPPRLKLLAEQLKKALEEARKRRGH
ncbi:hypothetical protein [Paracoccus shandongensis]|uniref:hypothetical protein n=1 Tax=Paracoccus shandongensis TaxID=2816048 RepID=UPI001A8F7F78|nr:hypothetical protein [Paracoccus shandongensis]